MYRHVKAFDSSEPFDKIQHPCYDHEYWVTPMDHIKTERLIINLPDLSEFFSQIYFDMHKSICRKNFTLIPHFHRQNPFATLNFLKEIWPRNLDL